MKLGFQSKPTKGSETPASGEPFRNSVILDYEIRKQYVFVLFEKNLIMAFDLRYSALGSNAEGKPAAQLTVEELVRFDRPVFQATFSDAQEQISQLYFVSDFHSAPE